MKTQIITNTEQFIPTLVLKNTVLFPDVALPVLVSKTVGLNAIQRALDMGKDKLFVAITLKEGVQIETATPTDFYQVGTLCTIERIEKNERGETIAFIKSLYRFRALQIKFDEVVSSWMVRGEPMPDIMDIDAPTETALLRSLKDISEEILTGLNASGEFKKTLDEFDNTAGFTNLAAQNLPLVLAKKQEILEIASVKNRALKILELLVEQREMIKVNNEMGAKISEKTSKAYREAILREQLKAIKEELGDEGSESIGAEGEKLTLKDRILQAKMPKEVEKVALDQLNRYETMGPQNAESHIIRNYIDLILALPWNDVEPKDINIDDAQKILDQDHYGLEKIKKHIVQHLAVMKLSPQKKGSILLFVGPPGVGKTSLGQSIAKALGRKFVRASLGGVRDDSEIRGHRRTYIGAMPGRIIEGLKRAKEKNAVFMLDEIDKLGHGYGGDPASALLEVLDPEQNSTFMDHYLDLTFDLSKIFFIATANTLETIPAPLLDRMEVINLTGYTTDEKVHIAKNHLLPKQLKEHGLNESQVEISDDILKMIAEEYTREAGVRDLQRKIAKILRTVSERVVRGIGAKIEIAPADVEEVLGIHKNSFERAQTKAMAGVVTGLAWTPMGGDILFIESLKMPGKGKIQLTGKLGDVMSESAHIGLSLVRSNLSGMLPGFNFAKTDFHVHVPSGSIPKDGPSAGITIFTALCSLVLGKPVDSKLAMTGEITLRGVVLPVGGIKEKMIAAHRAGIKKVILSKQNEKDLIEVPEAVKKDIQFYFIDNISELLTIVFGKLDGPYFADPLLSPPYIEDFEGKIAPRAEVR
ncbi:MAG: endopeptidase La [Bacteriovorax sp.]|jgi:ATP-dependent Lon protease